MVLRGHKNVTHIRIPYGVYTQLPLLMSMPCYSHFRPHRTQSCPNKKGLNHLFLLSCNVLVIHLSLMLTDNRRNTLIYCCSSNNKKYVARKSGHIYVARGLHIRYRIPDFSCCDQRRVFVVTSFLYNFINTNMKN